MNTFIRHNEQKWQMSSKKETKNERRYDILSKGKWVTQKYCANASITWQRSVKKMQAHYLIFIGLIKLWTWLTYTRYFFLLVTSSVLQDMLHSIL